jgi:hypothetical protein
MHLLAEPAFRPNAHTMADQQHLDHQLGIDRRPFRRAVERREIAAQLLSKYFDLGGIAFIKRAVAKLVAPSGKATSNSARTATTAVCAQAIWVFGISARAARASPAGLVH